MKLGLFLKRLFCNHIEELLEKKYLYSNGITISERFISFNEHYSYKFKCLKCGRERMEERILDVI